VTILAGIVGKFSLAKINDSQDLKQALQQIGSMGGDSTFGGRSDLDSPKRG
jgi:uncharacterized membrane protein